MRNEAVFVNPLSSEVWITGFAWDDPFRPSGMSDSDYIDFCMERLTVEQGFDSVPSYRLIPEGEASELDPYFRDAWNDVYFNVDMIKARKIHLSNIRKVRDAELEKLDIPFMQAVEDKDPDEIERIRILKQALRDIPQTFDLDIYTDSQELRTSWPLHLPKKT